MSEKWRPVVGYEGAYEVSNTGRVRSIARKVATSHGGVRTTPARELRGTTEPGRARRVVLSANGKTERSKRVCDLVMAAFGPPCPGRGLRVGHVGDASDDTIDNLVWVSACGGTRRSKQMTTPIDKHAKAEPPSPGQEAKTFRCPAYKATMSGRSCAQRHQIANEEGFTPTGERYIGVAYCRDCEAGAARSAAQPDAVPVLDGHRFCKPPARSKKPRPVNATPKVEPSYDAKRVDIGDADAIFVTGAGLAAGMVATAKDYATAILMRDDPAWVRARALELGDAAPVMVAVPAEAWLRASEMGAKHARAVQELADKLEEVRADCERLSRERAEMQRQRDELAVEKVRAESEAGSAEVVIAALKTETDRLTSKLEHLRQEYEADDRAALLRQIDDARAYHAEALNALDLALRHVEALKHEAKEASEGRPKSSEMAEPSEMAEELRRLRVTQRHLVDAVRHHAGREAVFSAEVDALREILTTERP